MTNSAELQLIKACQSGELHSFTELYELYFSKIYRFVFLKVRDKEQAEDITSETFFKALAKIKSFKPMAGAGFGSWLYKIAYHQVLDFYKKDKPLISLDEVMPFVGEESNLNEQLDSRAKLKEVLEFLNDIPTEQKDILVMRLWDDLSYKEIAEVTGKSVDNCKKIVSRNLQKVKDNVDYLMLLLVVLDK